MSGRRAHSPHLLWLVVSTLLIPVAAIAADKTCPKVKSIKARTEDGKIIDVKSANINLGDQLTVKIEAGGSQKDCDLGPATPQDTWLPGISNENALLLVPYLSGRQLKGVHPEAFDPVEHTVTFRMIRTNDAENKKVWSDLLSRPGLSPRVVSFSVGLENAVQIDTDIDALNIIVFTKRWLFAALAMFVIFVYVFLRLARRSTLLRDPGTSTGELPKVKDLFWPPFSAPKTNIQLGPYSLARTQMAIWSFLVVVSFVLIWIVIGDTDTITAGILTLIGISAGTTVGATAIDSSKRPTTPEPQPGKTSEGWFTDILSDETGISFHRFQIFVWTIVLGFVFCKDVFESLAMPDFSQNLLTLMGISSGTYVALKPFERSAPEAPPDTTNQGTQEPDKKADGGQQGNDQGTQEPDKKADGGQQGNDQGSTNTQGT